MLEPGGRGATVPPPQYLADQLTLFQPGRADYPHLLLLAMFFTFRHPCKSYLILKEIADTDFEIHKFPVCRLLLFSTNTGKKIDI